MIGGSGTDTADYSASGSGVTVNLGTNSHSGGDAAGDSLSGIENVTGSSHNDSLTGDGSANVLRGGAGNDTLVGNGGADDLFGDAGDDLFIMDETSLDLSGTSVQGGADTDTLRLESGSGAVDKAGLFDVLSDMEIIDFREAGVDATLNLSASDIQGVTDGGNQLTLQINAGDNISITDPVANYTTSVVGSTTTYTIYDDASHTTQLAELTVVTS
ncbi:MAG: hypothetical protein N4A65_14460 [Cohaesibacter sp.]|nr:hypothetical protein [Cohaesibacter sp.]